MYFILPVSLGTQELGYYLNSYNCDVIPDLKPHTQGDCHSGCI